METAPIITDLWVCFLRNVALFELQCADFNAEFGLDPEDREQRRSHARNLDVLADWLEKNRGGVPDLPSMNVPARVGRGV